MKHILTWCDIPVTDMARAQSFYAEVLNLAFTDHTMDGVEMACFTAEADQVSGSLVKGRDYQPSKTGTVVYLNAGKDLTESLERAQRLGATVLCPKTPIGDGSDGYFAQFADCEGNRVGLYSLQ